MNVSLSVQVCARFKLVVHKGDGVPVKETGWFDNLVLNSGLDRMSVGTWISMCCIGTGNSTPVETQTALDNFLASTATQQAYSYGTQETTAPFYRYGIKTWRFGLGVAAGNISEVGLGWGTTTLWNRALVRDINGNPTTITVLADEYLDVVSEVRDYPNVSGGGSFNLLNKDGGLISTHTYTKANALVTPSSTSDFVKIAPYGIQIAAPGSSTYSAHTTKTTTYPTARSVRSVFSLALADAVKDHGKIIISVDGILAGGGSYKGSRCEFIFSPAITKTNLLTMTYTFEMTWDRYTP